MAAAGCVIFYGAYQLWFSWLLLVAVLIFPWLSLLLSLPAMLSLRAVPETAERVYLGSAEEVYLRGVCRLPLPPMRGKLRVTRLMTGERWKLKSGHALPAEHCGGLLIEPLRLRVCDYLGLFALRVKKYGARTVLVLPNPVQTKIPPDFQRYLACAWKPKFGGGYAENHELRLYRPGDSLNQVHWKLSAKTGKLILREPMEPVRGLLLLTLDVNGTPEELDRKFGRLLYVGQYMLARALRFEIRALTAAGVETYSVSEPAELQKACEHLLCTAPAAGGSIRDRAYAASWQYHIGGEPDEA